VNFPPDGGLWTAGWAPGAGSYDVHKFA
jgi:hypothetical protein